jgi:hypothetical protein
MTTNIHPSDSMVPESELVKLRWRLQEEETIEETEEA